MLFRANGVDENISTERRRNPVVLQQKEGLALNRAVMRFLVVAAATVAPYMIVLAIAIVMAAVERTRGTIKMAVLYRGYLVDDNVNMAALIAGLSSILLRVLGIGHVFVGPAQTCAIFLLDSNRYGIPVSSAYSPHPKKLSPSMKIYTRRGSSCLCITDFLLEYYLFLHTYFA